MKRTRFSARERVSREAVELGRLAEGLARSGGKLEDAFWESRLRAVVDRLLQDGAEDDLSNALERLFENEPRAHDELADMIEARAESTQLDHDGKTWDVLLITAPLLAGSRFSIPTGSLPKSAIEALGTQFLAHLLAKDARFAIADYLFSPDQLPRSYSETWLMTRELGIAALGGRTMRIDAKSMPETNRFLSDVRYLLGAIAVPAGGPLFRWNEVDGNRDTALQAWVTQGAPLVEPALTGCAFQLLLPDAYHSACRQGDHASRPYAIQASVSYLQATVGLAPDQLRAVIGPFHDRRLEEFRISLGPLDSDDVYHGIVWPLLGAEDENTELASEIESVLQACGVKNIVSLDSRFPFEFCDECGVPLYPNAEGETVHAEMPESDNETQHILH